MGWYIFRGYVKLSGGKGGVFLKKRFLHQPLRRWGFFGAAHDVGRIVRRLELGKLWNFPKPSTGSLKLEVTWWPKKTQEGLRKYPEASCFVLRSVLDLFEVFLDLCSNRHVCSCMQTHIYKCIHMFITYNIFFCIYFCCTATDTFREIHQIGEDLDFCIFFWIHPEVLQVIGSAHVVQQPQQSQFSLSVPQKGIRLEV